MTAGAMRFILSLAILGLLGAILLVIATTSISQVTRDLMMIIIGVVVSEFRGVYSFYFGSSDGSKVKTDLMAKPQAPLDLTGSEEGQ